MLVTNHLLYNSDIRISHTFYSSSVQSVVLFSFFLTYLFWHQFIVMSVQCYFSSLWHLFTVIFLHCKYFLLWHQFIVMSVHCHFSHYDIFSLLLLFSVTSIYGDIFSLWHLYILNKLKYFKFKNFTLKKIYFLHF